MTSKSAIVTGASSGLGLSVAKRLTSRGYHVYGVSRNAATDSEWLSATEGGLATHVRGDVSTRETVSRVFDQATASQALDLVVNCAGQGVFGDAGSFSEEDIRQVLSGNLIGLIQFTERALGLWDGGAGTIVNVMSTAALVPRSGEAIYCAAKWGARGYTESVRLETKGSKTRVISVFPGGMDTPFWSRAKGDDFDASQFMDADSVAEVIERNIFDSSGHYVSDITINRK